MTMQRLEKLYERLQHAEANLAAAINQEFPVGTVVSVKMGRGHMGGTVSSETRSDTVIVRSDKSGKVHHKHFRDVTKFDE